MHPLAPTTVLPALATLPACNAARVEEALRALRVIYFPLGPVVKNPAPVLSQSLSEVVAAVRSKRAACVTHHDSIPDSGYASAEEDSEDEIDEREGFRDGDEALGILRSDELERGYAIKWLMGLVKRGDVWVCASSEEQEMRMKRLEDASRLLARFAGADTPEEAVTRKFTFPLRMPSCSDPDGSSPVPPIVVELNDAPVDGTDHTAVGLQSWGSAIIFAEWMCLNPGRYLGTLCPYGTVPVTAPSITDEAKTVLRQRRVLELGAGTGLLSITAAHIFSRMSSQAFIKATDYHPSVLENLSQNVQQNRSTIRVSVRKLDWSRADVGTIGDTEMGGYDVVLAADVIYHPEHARWIRGCVKRMLKRDGVFWMIIPMRTVGRHQGLDKTVEEVFPVAGRVDEDKNMEDTLTIVSREEIEKVDGVGRADEGGYTLFEIRWVYTLLSLVL